MAALGTQHSLAATDEAPGKKLGSKFTIPFKSCIFPPRIITSDCLASGAMDPDSRPDLGIEGLRSHVEGLWQFAVRAILNWTIQGIGGCLRTWQGT